jgi:hypothetical protein
VSTTQAYILVSDADLSLLEAAFGRDHPLCATARDAIADLDDPAAGKYRAAATAHARDGELEIDHNAIVSRGEDAGAYVMAWLWVSDEDTYQP